jgi:competence protein ComEC
VRNSLLEKFSIMPLFWIALAFLGGVVLASLVSLPKELWLALALLGLLIAIIVKRAHRQSLLLLLLLPGFLFLGAARYESQQPVITPDNIAYYNDNPQKVYITGTLAEPPDVRDTYTNLRIDVDAIDLGGNKGNIQVHGPLLVRLGKAYDLHYGDRVRVRGLVQTPPEDEEFSYSDYLALQGIHSILSTSTITLIPFGGHTDPIPAFIYRVRASLLNRVYKLFPEPEASLLAGILLGEDNNIPAELQQAFKNTGTSHIIAISGFNIAIIAGLFVILFSRFFGKRWGAVLAILGISFYTILVGASPSVVRAAIMGTLSILAGQVGRRNLPLNMLAFTAGVMALADPFVLWDVGFQLSFMATLGLVLYAQPMQDATAAFLTRHFPNAPVEKIVGPFSDFFLLTLAAQITTLPISAYHFQRISLVSIIANPLILPAQPPVMVLSGLAVALGRLYMPLGQVVAWIAWPFAAYTIRMVEFFNGLPGGVLPLESFSLLAVILFYLILFLLTQTGPRLTQFRAVLRPTVSLSVLMVLCVLTWRSVLNLPDGRLHVTVLDVGSSDAILITTPSGRMVLVNGGGSPSQLADQLGRRLPPFDRRLDYLVVASTQENEVAALPRTLEGLHPLNAFWAGNVQASFSSQQLDAWFSAHAVPVHLAQTGDDLDLGDGAKLRALAVSPSGAILSVEWRNFRVVLPIGVNFDMYEQLKYGKYLGPVTALLFAQSGYAPANPDQWLTNLQPQIALLSVAAGDPDGLPAPQPLKTLKDVNLFRTDANGWIDLASDGQNTWVTVEKK